MTDILEIEDLHVTHHDGTEALHGVCLTVARGEKVGLIGPNGAGKTSLLLAIMAGVSARGRIVVDGTQLVRGTADQVRSRCGMTFQDADDQLFMPTLLEDVAFGPLNQGLTPEAAKQRAKRAIAAVGLVGLDSHSAHHLSGGQKQNAALATILSMEVDLLLLDEPGVDLDARSRRRLVGILGGRDEAMLMATHDLDMVGALCSRAVLLDEGRVVAAGDCRKILDDSDLLREHGLI